MLPFFDKPSETSHSLLRTAVCFSFFYTPVLKTGRIMTCNHLRRPVGDVQQVCPHSYLNKSYPIFYQTNTQCLQTQYLGQARYPARQFKIYKKSYGPLVEISQELGPLYAHIVTFQMAGSWYEKFARKLYSSHRVLVMLRSLQKYNNYVRKFERSNLVANSMFQI